MFILVVTISTIAGLPMVMVHYKKNLARLGELFNVKDQDALTQLLGLVTDGVTTLDEQGQANWPQVGAEATYLLTEAECAAAFVARQTPVEISVVKGTTLYQK